MGLSVQPIVAAFNAYRNVMSSNSAVSSSLEKLSSGFRINRAADDAAGLAISEGLKSQIGGLTVAVRNAQDGTSVVQTAEGALTETQAILQRMRDLTVQSGNTGTLDAAGKADLQAEVTSLNSELDRTASKTTFNNVNLLDGSYTAQNFQVGYAGGDTIAVTINSGAAGKGFNSTDLGTSAVDLTAANTTTDLASIDAAIGKVSSARAALGATQNRFNHVVNSANVAIENLSASNSRIVDTDMASEMTKFTQAQILQQAGTAMLAQANSAPQSILKLLQ
jgi:flagellin